MAVKAKLYKQAGQVEDWTATGTVSAGTVQAIGDMAAIVVNDSGSAESACVYRSGIFQVNKTNCTVSIGDTMYWDNDGTDVGGATAGGATNVVGSGNFAMGRAVAAAAGGATSVIVELNKFGAQAADADILDSSTGTASGTLGASGIGGTSATAVDNNFATLATEVNALKAILRASGLLALA